MKQTLKIGITVLVVAALAMSGIALAQTTDGDAPAVEDTKAYGAIQEKLAPLVEEGTISQAQADIIAETLAEGMRPHRRHRGFKALKAAAEFLDLDREEMREALSEYDTLADIAAANGSSGAALIDHLVSQVEERLDQAVADEKMTAEEAADKLADAEEHITQLVNSEIPEPGERRGRRGPGGDQPDGGGQQGPPTTDI